MAEKILTTPISAKDLEDIRIGDILWLDGLITTCRDVAHRRLIDDDRPLPISLSGGAIFHAGPIVRRFPDPKTIRHRHIRSSPLIPMETTFLKKTNFFLPKEKNWSARQFPVRSSSFIKRFILLCIGCQLGVVFF